MSKDLRFLVALFSTAVLVLAGIAWWFLPNPVSHVGAERRAAKIARPNTDQTANSGQQQPEMASLAPEEPPRKRNEHGPTPPATRASSVARDSQLGGLLFADLQQVPSGFVGTATCKTCHADRHESYLNTHHSRSLREITSSDETKGKSFVHRNSNRSYEVTEKNGRLWHREWKYFGQPDRRYLSGELPACFVMGSGAFAKGYLLDAGDHLVQSPVTWYEETDKVGMAPGYEGKRHFGMTRLIDDQCLFCHAGLVSKRENNPNKPLIHELAIGCERCHGPGADHTQLYRDIESGKIASGVGEADAKIVHPAKLGRQAAESLCAQCHTNGDVVVDASDRELWDFRPGEDFSNTRVYLKRDEPGRASEAFTGHFDQMWQSKCYQKSESLTCMTCHPSHPDNNIDNRIEWRREQCNQCHSTEGCKVDLDQRAKKNLNDCVACHMPRIGTEVPHTSTTNHLIAVFENGKPRGRQETKQIAFRFVDRRVGDTDSAEKLEVMGRATWSIDAEIQNANELQRIREQVVQLLTGKPADASSDIHLNSILARLNRLQADSGPTDARRQSELQRLWNGAASAATKVLAAEKRPVRPREVALEVLGNERMFQGDHPAAIKHWTELTRIRRTAADWFNLGLCLARDRRMSDAEAALRQSIRIDGSYAPAYRSLSILYQSIDPSTSKQMAQMAQMLSAE